MTELSLIVVMFSLLIFVCWREWHTGKLINQLTNKIMSRDYQDYSTMSLNTNAFDNSKGQQPHKDSHPVKDPVLGGNF